MGYCPGFLLKNGQFPTLANSPEIDKNSTLRSQKSIQKGLGGFSESLERFPELTKSAMFKTMGYSPGFLLKNGQYPTLGNSPEIDTNGRARGQQSIQKGLAGVSESLERFRGLAKIRHVENHGLAQAFCSKTANIRPSRIHPKSTQTVPQGVRNPFPSMQQANLGFGAISRTYQSPPCSKPWAIAQAFCSKTANFRPSRIHPKSTQTVPQAVRNPFRWVQEAFWRVWSDFQDLPKSAMFETMGYSPGFLLKNGQYPTLANSPEIDTNSPARSSKSISKHVGGDSGSLERFPGLIKIRHVQNHGLQPRLFAQKRPIADPREFSRNPHKKSRNQLEIHFQACSRRFREFGAISRTYQNPPC